MYKVELRKRSIIETINDQLKNISQIEHTRHRSPANFLINLLSGLIAYQFKEKKPSINFDCLHKNMIKAARKPKTQVVSKKGSVPFRHRLLIL